MKSRAKVKKARSAGQKPRDPTIPFTSKKRRICPHCGLMLNPTTLWRHRTKSGQQTGPLSNRLRVATVYPGIDVNPQPYDPIFELTTEELALSPLHSSDLDNPETSGASAEPIAASLSAMSLDHITGADEPGQGDLDQSLGDNELESPVLEEVFHDQDADLDGIVDAGAVESTGSRSPEPNSPLQPTPSPSTSQQSTPVPSSAEPSLYRVRIDDDNQNGQMHDMSANLPPPMPIESNNVLWIGKHRLRSPITEDSPEFAAIKTYKLRIEIGLGANAYEKLRYTYPELDSLPSLKVLSGQMEAMAGMKPVLYDCCPNVCVCYTGVHSELTACPYCRQPRLRPNGKPYRQFPYLPILPQIQALYANKKTARAMRYRSEHHLDHVNDPEATISDIYHSSHYQSLLHEYVVIDGRRLSHKYFEEPQDVLLLNLTDGFRLFKRGNHSSWPLLLVNANLDPSDARYHVNSVICVGLIPGPHKPKDFDSFFSIVVAELEQGAIGVPTFDATTEELCRMHFYAPFGCGDMPAVAMAYTGGKQHNAKHACRECPIEGIRILNSRNPVHYVPIQRPPEYPAHDYDINNPPRRQHRSYLAQARRVDLAPPGESARLSTLYGINGTPITARIPGVRFPSSFPFDLMHLIENQLKNYTLLFCGEFKGFDNGVENYILDAVVWQAIGTAGVEANSTIPSAFGRKLPNIAQDRSFFTVEAYIVWWTMLAPILFRNRWQDLRYYQHIIDFISIINRCTAFSSTKAERDTLRTDIVAWYSEYERIFYQYNAARLPACLITVHAWLHLVDIIEESGPLWSYWCWIMERYCGRLSRAVSSRKHPYASLNRRILELQTIATIRNQYGLHDLLPDYSKMHNSSPPPSFKHALYPEITLCYSPRLIQLHGRGTGSTEIASLRERIAVHLATQLGPDCTVARVKELLPDSVTQWGKVQMQDGDSISTSLGYKRKEDNMRDTSYIQYEQLEDLNARRRKAPIVLQPKTFFGQLQRAIVCELAAAPDLKLEKPTTRILLDVHMCTTTVDRYGITGYRYMGGHEIIDGTALRAVVGRVKDRGRWAIVQRFGGMDHADYVDIDFGAT